MYNISYLVGDENGRLFGTANEDLRKKEEIDDKVISKVQFKSKFAMVIGLGLDRLEILEEQGSEHQKP